jgi:hypothetical protein
MVTNSWNMTSAMRAQYLRSLGFVVFIVDNRGSARRGLEFESAIRHDLGHLEVEDQEDGLLWLFNQGYGIPGLLACAAGLMVAIWHVAAWKVKRECSRQLLPVPQ